MNFVFESYACVQNLTKSRTTLFFIKDKLNKNIEAEIARKIRTIQEQYEAEIISLLKKIKNK